MSNRTTAITAARSGFLLEQALLLTFICHGIAMLFMAIVLLPGMPGAGQTADVRIAYIAAHPWLWRAGWFTWQLTAVSDVWIAVALLRTPWIPRFPAIMVLLLTLAAVIPDQVGQILWMTRGVQLAQAGRISTYLDFENRIFPWIAGWGALGYSLAAVSWSWCFAAARTWTRSLLMFSAVLWTLFILISLGPVLPAPFRPTSTVIAAGNGLGFVLMMIWFAMVTELVMRRSRPVLAHGRSALWLSPGRGWGGRISNLIAGSQFLRGLCAYVPVIAFLSDITDVIYVNYIVEAERIEPLVPEGLELQRLGPRGQFAFFTFLTFKHGHFGPRLFGRLRKLFPSPVQTNWRIHVVDPRTGYRGIYFVTNAITSLPHALAARLLSEGMPMHVLRSGVLAMADGGALHLRLDPGGGTAPDAEGVLHPAADRPTQGPWRLCFNSYDEMLAYCVPQDRALSSQPWRSRITRQEIDLGIPLDACEPLEGEVCSHAASAIVGDCESFSFRVASVRFRFEREEYDPMALD
jgi:hypothetical protein